MAQQIHFLREFSDRPHDRVFLCDEKIMHRLERNLGRRGRNFTASRSDHEAMWIVTIYANTPYALKLQLHRESFNPKTKACSIPHPLEDNQYDWDEPSDRMFPYHCRF